MSRSFLLVSMLVAAHLATAASQFSFSPGNNSQSWKSSGSDYSMFMNNRALTNDTLSADVNINDLVLSDAVQLAAGDTVTLYTTLDLEPGFYDIVAQVELKSLTANCRLFGKGTGYSMGSTMVPIMLDNQTQNVYVKGVGTTDGKLVVGLFSDGVSQLTLKGLSVTASSAFEYLQGGDVTMINYVLDNGGKYYDRNGNLITDDNASLEENARAVVGFLADNGMNVVRIRLSNNPGTASTDNTGTYCLPDGYQDEDDCLALAQYAHDAGMKIQFTFNWSDYWSNGSRQNIPSDWLDSIAGLSSNDDIVNKLTSCCYYYTKRVMQKLADLDIYPDYVSLGNETNGGFLFPYGYSYDVSADDATDDMPQGSANWKAIAKFVNAGYYAVKEVSPNSQVVIHLADETYNYIDSNREGNVDYYVYTWYFEQLEKYGGNYDVIGASYYPSWSVATAAEASLYFKQLMNKFNKDILVMETGYNWTEKRKDGYDGQLPYTAASYSSVFPFSQDGQKGFMAEVVNSQKGCVSDNGNRVLGDLYWDPMMIHVEDEWGNNVTGWAMWAQWGTVDANVVENTTFFDFDGKALPVFEVYRNNQNSEKLEKHHISYQLDDRCLAETAVDSMFFGESVSLRFSADSNYKVDSVIVYDVNNSVIFVSQADSICYQMPDCDVLVKAFVSEVELDNMDETCVKNIDSDDIVVYANNGNLHILSLSAEVRNVVVYDSAGRAVFSASVAPFQSVRITAPAGIYYVAGHKLVVKN